MAIMLYVTLCFFLSFAAQKNHFAHSHQLAENTPIDEVRGYYRREHSLIKPYQGSGPDIPFWSFGGSTMVTDKFIRLTADTRSVHGVLWNTIPVMSRDWEVVLSLRVHGTTGDMYGDGMAFWYAKEPDPLAQHNSIFGYKNPFDGLGIFVDTYSNHNGPHNHAHPYISAMVNNGSIMYDHDTDGTHTQLGGDKGCTARLRNKDYDTNLMIRYVDDTISVYLDIDNKNHWRECFSVPQVQLPTGYYFGLSAATGDLSDNHDIIALKTYEIDVIRVAKEKDTVDRGKLVPEAKIVAAPRDHVDGPKPSRLSGWGATVAVILALIVVAGVVIVGVLVLQKRQENSRKRFY